MDVIKHNIVCEPEPNGSSQSRMFQRLSRNFSRQSCPIFGQVLLFCLLATRLLGAEAASPAPVTNSLPVISVRLQPDADCKQVIFIDQSIIVTFEDIQKSGGRLLTNNLTLMLISNGKCLQLGDSQHKIVVSADGLAGFKGELDPGAWASMCRCKDPSTLDIGTPAGNQGLVKLTFPDGGTAEMGPNSRARFDLFVDQTYTLSGAGQIRGVNADGQQFILTGRQPPVTGGPLISVTGPDGSTRLQRATPQTAVKISSPDGETLIVTIGTQKTELTPGETESITLPNGSVLTLGQGPNPNSLKWDVDKGHLLFTVDAIGGWQGIGLTEQAGLIRWDTSNRAIDFQNLSGAEAGPLYANMPRRTTGVVMPGATLQYMNVNPQTFATASFGGEVYLYNAITRTEIELSQGSLVFTPQRPGGTTTTSTREAVAIKWDNGVPAEITSGLGNVTMQEGESIRLPNDVSPRLGLEYSPGGTMGIEALSGDFLILPTEIPSWSIALSEGSAMSMTVDLQKGKYSIAASSANSDFIVIQTGLGTAQLGAGSKIVEITSGSGFGGVGNGNLLFFEAAGADTFFSPNGSPNSTSLGGSGSSPLSDITPGGGGLITDVSRLGLPPASPE